MSPPQGICSFKKNANARGLAQGGDGHCWNWPLLFAGYMCPYKYHFLIKSYFWGAGSLTKAATTHISQSGIRIWPVTVSQYQSTEVRLIPKAWELAGMLVTNLYQTIKFYWLTDQFSFYQYKLSFIIVFIFITILQVLNCTFKVTPTKSTDP